MKKIIYISLLLWLPYFSSTVLSTNSSITNDTGKFSFLAENMDYRVRAFFTIGGSVPPSFPREIRKIEGFNPTLQLGLEANATNWFEEYDDWGIRLGIRFEGKGMKTDAMVKSYKTQVIGDAGEKIEGYFTGKVNTVVNNNYFTAPFSVVYNLSNRWNIYGGLYFSALIAENFTGYVYDGYLRKNDPTGEKIEFSGENKGPYDFSKELNPFQWGGQCGAEWALNKHFELYTEFGYGFNGILKNDFEAISFSLHNIGVNVGFSYKF